MWSLVLSVGGGEAQDREGAPGGLGEIQEGSLWEGGFELQFPQAEGGRKGAIFLSPILCRPPPDSSGCCFAAIDAEG